MIFDASTKESHMKSEKSESNGHGHAANDKTPTNKRVKSLRALISQYECDPKLSRSHRLAHFLDWLAQRAPFTPVPPAIALQAIQGYARTPPINSDEVRSLWRNSVKSAREILRKDYRRGLDVEDGMMCATVDDQHCADTQQRKNVKRLISATKRVKETASIIDATKIKDEKLRNWIRGPVATAMKTLDAESRLDKLLPPPKYAAEDKK